MLRMRSRQTQGRKLIFLLVLLGHCALILIISRSNATRKSATQILHEPLFVFFLDSINPKTETGAAKESTPPKPRTVLPRPNAESPSDLSKPNVSDPTSSNAIIDWYSEAHTAAEDALEKERNKSPQRAFEHKMPSAAESGKAGIFDPPPVPRAGTWEGPDRFYVTDNCYYDYDRAPRPPPTALDHRLQTPVCKPPPKGGGDAMFKDLTPDYLKTLPEPKKP
jgi:hypothetical protein